MGRRHADGHPAVFNVSTFELGNEQYVRYSHTLLVLSRNSTYSTLRLYLFSLLLLSCCLAIRYNPDFVEQVAAMEARAAKLNGAQGAGAVPPMRYMVPFNSGLSAADAQRALDAKLPVERILPDVHVGAKGAVEAAAKLFASPPVPGFDQGAINCETNAGSHDLQRALDEAADLIDWFTADTAVTDRLYVCSRARD